MKKLIIIMLLLLFSLVACAETTTTAISYYNQMEEILYPIEIELQNGITRTDRVLVSHMYKITTENIVVYYSQDTGIYYIYKLNNAVLDDNCTIATIEELENIFK